MVVKFVVFLINLKPCNIFSLIVIMLVFSGVQFIGCLVPLQQVYLICLGHGQNWATTNTICLFWQEHRPWAIWLTRNDFVFNKSQKQTFLQVLFRGTCWHAGFHFCRYLLQCLDEYKTSILEACRLIEYSAMFLFAYHGWSFSYRIGLMIGVLVLFLAWVYNNWSDSFSQRNDEAGAFVSIIKKKVTSWPSWTRVVLFSLRK